MHLLPLSQKGQSSHLFVVLSGGCLSCLLVVADYEESRSFSEYCDFPVSRDFDILNLDSFLQDILGTWGEAIGWKILKCEDEVCMPMAGEGEGIDSASLIVSKEYYSKGLRSILLGVDAVLVSDKCLIDGMARYMGSLGVTDMISVFLDWDEIIVLFLTQTGKSDGSGGSNIKVREFRIEGDNSFHKLGPNIRNLLSVNFPGEDLKSVFANVMNMRIVRSRSPEVWDLLRSYITVSLFNVKDVIFRKFGMETKDALLTISGDMARVVPVDQLFISVIDGLQLRGRYKFAVDNQSRMTVGAVSLGKKEFACPIREVYPPGYMYISTEKGGSGVLGKACFRGKISHQSSHGNDLVENMIIGQVGQMYTFDVKGEGNILIKPERSVYFPNLERQGEYLRGKFSEGIDKIVVDCRRIPAVYGPDVEANSRRVSGWLQGLNLNYDAD